MTFLALAASMALDAVAVALLAWVTWRAVRQRERPNAWPFVALSGALLLWAVFSLASELPHAWSPVSGVVSVGQLLPAVFVSGIWTVYVLGYTGRGVGLSRLRVAMFAGLGLPLVGAAAVFAVESTEIGITRGIAPLIGLELTLMAALTLYSTYVFVSYGWSHARISKRQVGVQTAAVAAPYLVGTWRDGGVIVDGVTGGLLLSGLLLAVAVSRYPVLTGFPKADYVARSRVVEALREAVFVLDWEGHVLDANAAAARLFDRPAPEMIGRPVGSIVDGIEGVDLQPGGTGETTLHTTEGRRQFQFSVSAVEGGDDGGDPVARAVVLRDVTDQHTREQRLAVLNRVLRHNVRNKLDVILAHADHVDDEARREAIRGSATTLSSLSRKARDAEAVMTESIGAPESVDLAAVADEVAQEYRQAHPDSEISVDAPEGVRIDSHRAVLRRLLVELVENAIVHATDPAPTVTIEVRSGADGAALTVRDHGPGIPDREREIIAGEAETQLEHGLGIGLWFVNWAVLQLGGELSFAENEPTGTAVTVRLYGADGPRPGDDGDEAADR